MDKEDKVLEGEYIPAGQNAGQDAQFSEPVITIITEPSKAPPQSAFFTFHPNMSTNPAWSASPSAMPSTAKPFTITMPTPVSSGAASFNPSSIHFRKK